MNNWIFFLFFIMISCFNNKQNYTIYNNQDNKYWSDKVEDIDLVMSYILSDYQEYKKMKKMNNQDKRKFLDNFFSNLDPDTTTIANESLDELNKRVMMSKKLFSDFDGGLLSDRARIYIIYGPPINQHEGYQNNSEVLIWQYEIDGELVEFKFIDNTFGRYKLIIDDFNHINN